MLPTTPQELLWAIALMCCTQLLVLILKVTKVNLGEKYWDHSCQTIALDIFELLSPFYPIRNNVPRRWGPHWVG